MTSTMALTYDSRNFENDVDNFDDANGKSSNDDIDNDVDR